MHSAPNDTKARTTTAAPPRKPVVEDAAAFSRTAADVVAQLTKIAGTAEEGRAALAKTVGDLSKLVVEVAAEIGRLRQEHEAIAAMVKSIPGPVGRPVAKSLGGPALAPRDEIADRLPPESRAVYLDIMARYGGR
jgi:hypothetical protein